MKKTCLMLVILILMTACSSVPKDQRETISSCSSTIDSLSALLDGYDLPEYFQIETPIKQGGEFDVMQYFTVLDHLSVRPGYVLDYIYHFDWMGGFPILYARLVDQPAYANADDLYAAGGDTNYLAYVQTDDTPESYFQYVMLAKSSDQFYLFWHANYNDSRIVCDRKAVGNITAQLDGSFGYPLSWFERFRAFFLSDITPSVVMTDQTVQVRIVTFTRWGGFYRETYIIDRGTPHNILEKQQQNLIPYQCGVMF
jgi:hypothetical protein